MAFGKSAVWKNEIIMCWISSERYERSGNLWRCMDSYFQHSAAFYLNSVKGVRSEVDDILCWIIAFYSVEPEEDSFSCLVDLSEVNIDRVELILIE